MPEAQINQVVRSNYSLLSWTADARPFKKLTREQMRTIGAIVFLVVVILFFANEFLLIGAGLAVTFVVFVLYSVPPVTIQNQITHLGVQTGEHFHKWDEMYEFWFDERFGQKMVVIRLLWGFPTHLQLLLGEASADQIKKLLSEKIPFKAKPERTFLDNAASWLQKALPLDKVTQTTPKPL